MQLLQHHQRLHNIINGSSRNSSQNSHAVATQNSWHLTLSSRMVADDDEDLTTVAFIFAAAHWYNSLRNRSRLTRSAVLLPHVSPWNRLLNNGDDGSFLEMTGFSRPAFNELRSVLILDEENIRRPGRPQLLDTTGQLGLYLFYVGSQMKSKQLCLLFGVVPSAANLVILRMISLICRI